VYPEGTEVSTTLNGVATFSTVKGTTFGQCTESNQVFKINLGKEDAFYTKEMFFSGCSEISIEPFHPTGSETTLWYPGTHNGALTPYMQMDIHMFGVVCRYYGTPYLSVFGGTSAQIVANSVPLVRMKGNELLCPTEIRLAAQWNVTTPNPLYVEQL
jgi:hypothetical protein